MQAKLTLPPPSKVKSLDEALAALTKQPKTKRANISGWHCGQKDEPDGHDEYYDLLGGLLDINVIRAFKSKECILIKIRAGHIGLTSSPDLLLYAARELQKARRWIAAVNTRLGVKYAS